MFSAGVNECLDRNVHQCDQLCIDTYDSFYCGCNEGFRLSNQLVGFCSRKDIFTFICLSNRLRTDQLLYQLLVYFQSSSIVTKRAMESSAGVTIEIQLGQSTVQIALVCTYSNMF